MSDLVHASQPRVSALHAIRDRITGNSCSVQCARLLETMRTLDHCTTFEASRHLDIYDPRARKMGLVKAGIAILTTWRHVETEAGRPHRIGVYSLDAARARGHAAVLRSILFEDGGSRAVAMLDRNGETLRVPIRSVDQIELAALSDSELRQIALALADQSKAQRGAA